VKRQRPIGCLVTDRLGIERFRAAAGPNADSRHQVRAFSGKGVRICVTESLLVTSDETIGVREDDV
jgi:hypothetical protein